MSHASGTVITFVGPIFADPEVRATLEASVCTKIDAILQKTDLTRRDRRCLSRALEDWLMHDDQED